MQFYEGRVVDGSNVLSPEYKKDWHGRFPPLSLFDLRAGGEETDESGSKFNEVEAVLVRQLVKQITKLNRSLSVAIITPYAAQVERLSHLQRLYPCGDNSNTGVVSTTATSADSADLTNSVDMPAGRGYHSVRVFTIDGVQGQECDVVIFSTVRSNPENRVGFLSDARRLNVAITRARFSLIVIGNADTLSSDRNWEALVKHTTAHGLVRGAHNEPLIHSAVKKWETSENRLQQLMRSEADVFGAAPWAVSLGSELKTAISKIEEHTRALWLRAVLALTNGEWPKNELQCTLVHPRFLGCVHVFRVKGWRLIWSVDVNQSTNTQVVVLTQY